MSSKHIPSVESDLARLKAAEVFLANSNFLMNVLLKDLPEHDANDVFQNLFINFFMKGLPDNQKNLRAYLYKAAQRDIIDHKRKSKKDQNNLQRYAQEKVPKPSSDPAKKIAQFDQIMKAFEMIKKHHGPSVYEAFAQKFQYNLNHHEIAEKLGISKSTVDRYLSVAMKQNQELSKYFLGGPDEQI